MTELEILSGNINELKGWMDLAWRDLANSSLTTFERRELRNEMKRCSEELRHCLRLVDAERARSRKQFPADHARFDFGTLNFRLIGQTERSLGVAIPEEAAPPSSR
jgi:hypothetical protein